MTDDEIKTKRLSDWKPETDIKLQKAFGKFVEESGELLEAIEAYQFSYDNASDLEARQNLEDELADCEAVTVMIESAATPVLDVMSNLEQVTISEDVKWHQDSNDIMLFLTKQLGRTLSIVGRCQIQGLAGKQPESNDWNREVLTKELVLLRVVIRYVVKSQSLNVDRIGQRKQAKIDSKLPWVMGTATDLLPDPSSCDHDWKYSGYDRAGSHKGEDAYVCKKCGKTRYDQ